MFSHCFGFATEHTNIEIPLCTIKCNKSYVSHCQSDSKITQLFTARRKSCLRFNTEIAKRSNKKRGDGNGLKIEKREQSSVSGLPLQFVDK